jgi:hypothetical protein
LKVAGSGNAAFGSMKVYSDTVVPPLARLQLQLGKRWSPTLAQLIRLKRLLTGLTDQVK